MSIEINSSGALTDREVQRVTLVAASIMHDMDKDKVTEAFRSS
jgi:hypothetical protein